MALENNASISVNSCKTARHVDVALLLEAHLKPHEKFFIPNYDVYRTNCFPVLNKETAIAVRKVSHITVLTYLLLCRQQKPGYRLETAKFNLQLFINCRVNPGAMQMSLKFLTYF